MNEYYGTEYIKEDKPKAEACFIDPDTGEFVLRVSEGYDFPEGISSPGYGEGLDGVVVGQLSGGAEY